MAWCKRNIRYGKSIDGKDPSCSECILAYLYCSALVPHRCEQSKKLFAGLFPVGFHGSKQSFISRLHPVSTVWWGYTYYFCTMLLHQTQKFYIVNVASIPIHYEHMLLGVLFRSKKLHKLFIKLHKKFFVDLPVFRTANDGIWWGACSPV